MNTKMCHKLKLSLFLAVLISCLVQFCSCSNLFDDIETPNSDAVTVMLTGTIRSVFSDTGAVPAEYAALFSRAADGAESASVSATSRAAIPTLPTSGLTTTVSATADDGDTIAAQTLADTTFTIPLKSGKKWTVTVTMKNNDTEMLSDSKEFDLTSVGAVSHEFVLKPVTVGTGNIGLSLSIDASSITYLSINIDGINPTAWMKSSNKWAPLGSTSSTTNPSITRKNLNTGVYTAILRFYSGDEENRALIYSTSQEINVLPTLTTDKWVVDGVVSNTLSITDQMVSTYGRTDFFVGNCGSATPSDTEGTGSPYKPFATITKAVSLINAMPTGNYTIHVKDGTTENISSTISISKNITIECWKNTVGDNLGTATLTRNANGDIFSIGSGGALTIDGKKTVDDHWSGLILDGNKDADITGSGITINSNGTLTLNGGVIRNCSYEKGAGIYVNQNGTFTMNGGMISNNVSTNIGGGVYIYYSTATITNGIINENTAASGGGIYFEGSTSTAGKAILNMTGGSIKRNSASTQGGGIYNKSGILYMSGNAIIGDDNQTTAATDTENCSNYALNGGGISSSGNYNTLLLGYTPNPDPTGEPIPDDNFSGGIFYNYSTNNSTNAQTNGGGICQYNGETKLYKCKIMNNGASRGGALILDATASCFIDTGTIISGNSASVRGNGIYHKASGILSINGSAYIASDNDVYLESGKKITIAGELTPPPEASGITATITPSSTTIGTAVLALAEGVTDTSISKERIKFNVSGTNLYIDTNGCLGEADISLSSSTDQTALGNELQTNDTVIVNLESDFTPTPLESYSNGGNFSAGGKDCVIEVPAGKTLVLSSDTPVTLEPSVFSGYFFDVKGTLIIGQNITISGKSGNTSRLHWNIIAIRSEGKVILKGGTIKDNTSGGATVGAVRIFGGGIFTMESGLITDSRGGVCIHDNGTFVMNGGEISNNTSSGVVVNSNGIFIKTGGSVKNNTNSSKPDKSQLLISAGGKYGSSNNSLTTYSEDYGLADAF